MRKLLLLFFLLAAGYITAAETIQESTLKNMGYKDFYIRGSDSFACSEYLLPFQSDTNVGIFPILSLKVIYLPESRGTPVLKVFLGDSGEPLAEYLPHDIEKGVARIVLPLERMGERNLVRICGKAAPDNTILVASDSTYGLYRIPYFPKGKGLEVGLETYNPLVGVPFEIVATARNYGSVDAEVSLSYRLLDLKEALPEASVLDGETSKSGVVKACSEWAADKRCLRPGFLDISYKAVAHKGVPMTLLPAVMVYNDVFGEEMVISNRPDIGAVDANRVSGQVLLENDKSFAGEKIPLKILVKNAGVPARDIKVRLRAGLEVSGGDSRTISMLNEGQAQELQFEAMATRQGNYEVGCTFEYEGRQFECPSTNILLERRVLAPELAGAGILTLLGLGVFVYFYYIKKEES